MFFSSKLCNNLIVKVVVLYAFVKRIALGNYIFINYIGFFDV